MISEDKLVSIIVPVYNVEDYLETCLNSILNQKYTNLELIVVDDGSTDNSGNICDMFSRKDGRVQVIHKNNGGLSSARNVGIGRANGEYIGFVDSDDYIAEEMVQELLSMLLKYHAQISICNRWHEQEDGTQTIRCKGTDKILVMDSGEAILEMNSFRSFDMSACDKLYKKELFENIRFPEGKKSEDFYIMYRLFDAASRVCYTSRPLYYYRQREGSITHSRAVSFDFIKAAKEQMDFIENKYPHLRECAHSAYASANMTVYNLHKKNHVACPEETKKELQKQVRDNLLYVKHNPHLPVIKKIQAILFGYSLFLYDFSFGIYMKWHSIG